MDICDSASDCTELFLDLAMRQHASRCQRPPPLPECSHCEETLVHVFASGVRAKYCFDCIEELRNEN